MAAELTQLMLGLKKDEAHALALQRAQAGEDCLQIIEDCRIGMVSVGERFQRGESFLAEIMLVGEILKVILADLEPYMKGEVERGKLGKIVVATLQGDIHDLGKNITANLLKANGFEIFDLGVDVPVQVLIDKVKEVKPDFVGFSSLLTTTTPVMKQAVDQLIEIGMRDRLKVLIGGGVTTPQTKVFVGADFQTTDAMATVDFCKKICGGKA
jgi:methanogenic corrinoid protein MtbC1